MDLSKQKQTNAVLSSLQVSFCMRTHRHTVCTDAPTLLQILPLHSANTMARWQTCCVRPGTSLSAYIVVVHLRGQCADVLSLSNA